MVAIAFAKGINKEQQSHDTEYLGSSSCIYPDMSVSYF